jgi:O-antigen/teichoic acid export membrane protein
MLGLKLARNILSNYFLGAVSAVSTLILTPLLFHHLTPVYFGVFTFALAVVVLAEGLDLGLGSGLVRFVSDYSERRRTAELRVLVDTVFFLLAGLGALLWLGLWLGSGFFVGLFHMDAEVASSAVPALALAAAALPLQLPCAALRAYLIGTHDFYLANVVDLAVQTLRLLLIVALVWSGFGLMAVVLVYPGIALVRVAGLLVACRRASIPYCPDLSGVSVASLRPVWQFSGAAFVVDATTSGLHQTDTLIVARFLGMGELALLAVARRLPYTLLQLVHRAVVATPPAIAALNAQGKRRELVDVSLVSLRWVLAIASALALPLILWAETVVLLWIGPEGLGAVVPLQALAVFGFFAAAQDPILALLYGIGRLRFSSVVATLLLAAAAGAGSLAAVAWGLTGVAVAWALLQGTATIALGWYAARLLEIPVGDLWKRGIAPAIFSAAGSAGCMLVLRAFLPHLAGFLLSLALVVVVYGLVFARMGYLPFRRRGEPPPPAVAG